MTKIIELRPNKSLLNTNFEKYQFCTENIPIEIEKKLVNEVFHLEANTTRESWLEARLFALHNHLFVNPFDSSCWFVDNTGIVWQFINGNLKKIHTLKTVDKSHICTKYNPSIGFTNKNITVISNGSKNLEILINNENEEKEFFHFEDIESGIILDCQQMNDSNLMIISIYSVVEIEGKVHSRLTLLTYSYEKNESSSSSLTLYRTQILKVKGTVDYLYIEDNGNYFHTASQDPIVFEYDSLNPIKIVEKNSNDTSIMGIKIPKYCWSQNDDSVTVWLKIVEKCKNISPQIDVKPTQISVSMKDVVLIQGETQHKLESDLTTWKIKDDTLEIEFIKSESGLMWSELLKGDTGGEFLPNESLAAEIHSRLAHLCSDQPERVEQPALGFNSEQLEECDLEGRENVLQRVNMNTHSTSNLSMLGSSNCILFTQKIKSGQMLCFRHDHDGCIWTTKQSDNENWELEHIWTFPAFGYVEASKTNKKFCVSPSEISDASFIAIVEHTRHVFIYKKPENNAVVGKQYIIDFGNKTILGAAWINKYLIVLTKDMLYCLRIY
ncbi:nudC domain-containing protein 1-like [Leptopilina boulardi]|uniref:nudC domain-containing protein 1-like n=1 Tax=Leptopilina boulardi TaxID=63433 RepID=UPI0021F5B5E8|nr:nudC domain-containing protein 1-like [Leptopilina boulardi]